MFVIVLIITTILLSAIAAFFSWRHLKHGAQQFKTNELLTEIKTKLDERDRFQQDLRDNLMQLIKEQRAEQQTKHTEFTKHQFDNLKAIIDALQQGMAEIRSQIVTTLNHNAQHLSERFNKLTDDTNLRLKEISGQVEKRLSEGFEKTTNLFTDVVKRLALIDKAQEKITELSGNVISLQEILADKRSRGAFGEVQLEALVSNVLPANHFQMQYELNNKKRADCVLFLPEPTGKIAIDAKFPLEDYQRMTDFDLQDSERKLARQQFYQAIRKHIDDIASKYIIAGETADFALMFIPAEAIFAEIHAHHGELVGNSHHNHVFMVSPTTMMAILTTARAVIKDSATRKQFNIIREHLRKLSEDFGRFQTRMSDLAKHIGQAHQDVAEVHTSSQKISARFTKIEQVEMDSKEDAGRE